MIEILMNLYGFGGAVFFTSTVTGYAASVERLQPKELHIAQNSSMRQLVHEHEQWDSAAIAECCVPVG